MFGSSSSLPPFVGGGSGLMFESVGNAGDTLDQRPFMHEHLFPKSGQKSYEHYVFTTIRFSKAITSSEVFIRQDIFVFKIIIMQEYFSRIHFTVDW